MTITVPEFTFDLWWIPLGYVVIRYLLCFVMMGIMWWKMH